MHDWVVRRNVAMVQTRTCRNQGGKGQAASRRVLSPTTSCYPRCRIPSSFAGRPDCRLCPLRSTMDSSSPDVLSERYPVGIPYASQQLQKHLGDLSGNREQWQLEVIEEKLTTCPEWNGSVSIWQWWSSKRRHERGCIGGLRKSASMWRLPKSTVRGYAEAAGSPSGAWVVSLVGTSPSTDLEASGVRLQYCLRKNVDLTSCARWCIMCSRFHIVEPRSSSLPAYLRNHEFRTVNELTEDKWAMSTTQWSLQYTALSSPVE